MTISNKVLRAKASIAATETGSALDLRHYMDVMRQNDIEIILSVGTATGTSPTLDIKMQHSPDTTFWIDGVTMTQATGATTEEKPLTLISRYIRFVATIGGTDTPTFTDFELHISFYMRPGGGDPHT